jgi:hypothetical protein
MEDGLRVWVGVDEPMGAVITSGCESSASERVLRPASGCWELCVPLQSPLPPFIDTGATLGWFAMKPAAMFISTLERAKPPEESHPYKHVMLIRSLGSASQNMLCT